VAGVVTTTGDGSVTATLSPGGSTANQLSGYKISSLRRGGAISASTGLSAMTVTGTELCRGGAGRPLLIVSYLSSAARGIRRWLGTLYTSAIAARV